MYFFWWKTIRATRSCLFCVSLYTGAYSTSLYCNWSVNWCFVPVSRTLSVRVDFHSLETHRSCSYYLQPSIHYSWIPREWATLIFDYCSESCDTSIRCTDFHHVQFFNSLTSVIYDRKTIFLFSFQIYVMLFLFYFIIKRFKEVWKIILIRIIICVLDFCISPDIT